MENIPDEYQIDISTSDKLQELIGKLNSNHTSESNIENPITMAKYTESDNSITDLITSKISNINILTSPRSNISVVNDDIKSSSPKSITTENYQHRPPNCS